MEPSTPGCPRCRELEAIVADLQRKITVLAQVCEAQQREIEELKARLGRDSSNSSRPPSADSPYAKPRRRKKRSKRKPGGQPGHPGSHRALLDVKEVDHVERLFPHNCDACDHALPQVPDGDPERKQVWEIPPVAPEVTEYQLFAVICPHCGKRTVAAVPPDVPRGSFGPRAEATAVYFQGAAHLSVRETQRAFADLFGLPISIGALSRIAARATEALEPQHTEALDAVRGAPVVHADETPWYLKGRLSWLWFAGTEALRVFKIDQRRTIDARRRFLGNALLGLLVADRYVAYDEQPIERRQFCLAHLKRDAKALVARGGAAKAFGTRLLALLRSAFAQWRTFQDEHQDRDLMRKRLRPTWQKLVELLVKGAESDHDRVANFSAHLILKAEAMWTFTEVEGCPPTNNLAERSLRKPVLWRKGSLGSQSEWGCRFVERILTVVESLRAQSRELLPFIVETLLATAQGRAPPSVVTHSVV
jgi:transposase